MSRFSVFALISLFGSIAHADVIFTARTDSPSIGVDESVSLRMNVQTDGSIRGVDAPEFEAPDFEVMNTFQSTSVESYYENGQISVKNQFQVTSVLRPKKTGNLKISRIQVKVGGKTYQADPITVEVVGGGAGSAAPRGYGQPGLMPQQPSQQLGKGKPFLVRVELNKSQAFKGEQVIASYYLYRKVKIFNLDVRKYPELNGFLKEEIELPIMNRQLQWESVAVDGVAYERLLVARYAIYPLKEGKLTVDALNIEAGYYGGGRGDQDEDDPFQFFRQMTPQTSRVQSDPVALEVFQLPTANRPKNFSGGVGEFEVSGGLNKSQASTGEAVILTLRVQGRGNLAGLEIPQWKPSEGVELFDTKEKIQPGNAGISEKVIEYTLIPRKSGIFQLPDLTLSYFDPKLKKYTESKVSGLSLEVTLGTGSKSQASSEGAIQLPPQEAKKLDSQQLVFDYKVPDAETGVDRALYYVKKIPVILWLGVSFILLVITAFFLFLMERGWLNKQTKVLGRKPKRSSDREIWGRLRSRSSKADKSEVGKIYDEVIQVLIQEIDEFYGIGAKSISRYDLGRILVNEKGLSPEKWKSLEMLFEEAEQFRFSKSDQEKDPKRLLAFIEAAEAATSSFTYSK